MAKILVVDDELSMREFLQILLEGEGHEVMTADCVARALTACREDAPELVFVDLKLPDGSGLDVLRAARDGHLQAQVIMMTAYATTQTAVEAMRLGAYDYQLKPFHVEELRVLTAKALEKSRLIRENRELRDQLAGRWGLTRIVGRSPSMLEVLALIEKVAPTRTHVLIEGESGTGKELAARALHERSPQAGGPFVPVNCGAIPETLIEAELFGYVAGAFTGAAKAHPGLFEAANGGTLLLDEVGELPMSAQVKLLRALQEHAVRRLGDDRERGVDVRVIASSNRDLGAMVRAGAFREDLFYRLNVVRLRLPPLRERPEDIALLAHALLDKYAREGGKPIEGFAPEAVGVLSIYGFPGNVRELENCVQRAVALATGPLVGVDLLPREMRSAAEVAAAPVVEFSQGGIKLDQILETVERRLITEALRRSDGIKTRAAELLGLSFRSLRYRLQKLGFGQDNDEPEEG